jgi:hypothetical protein
MTALTRAAARIQFAFCAGVSRGVTRTPLMNAVSCDVAAVTLRVEKSRSARISRNASDDRRLVATFAAAVTVACSATSWSWMPSTVTLKELGIAALPAGSLALQVTVVVLVFAFGASRKKEPDAGEQEVAICAAGLSGSVTVTP